MFVIFVVHKCETIDLATVLNSFWYLQEIRFTAAFIVVHSLECYVFTLRILVLFFVFFLRKQ